MKVPYEALGMLFLIIEGMMQPLFLVFSRFALAANWPFYRLNAVVLLLLGAAIYAYRAYAGTLSREWMVVKWVFLRGFTGTLFFILQLLAAPIAPIGDILALGTLNIVVASLLGMLFLHEKLGITQILAGAFSLSGAVLITRPSFIFGGAAVSSDTAVGYIFALSGGFANAASVMCSRRVEAAPVNELSASCLVQIGIVLLILPGTPICHDPSWEPVLAAPGVALLMAFGLTVCTMLDSTMFVLGFKWLPVAVSCTVSNAAVLVFGYVSQWLFFAKAPGYLTVVGASLMLLSVVLVGASRARVPPAVSRSLSQLRLMTSTPSLGEMAGLPGMDAADVAHSAVQQAEDASQACSHTSVDTAEAVETQHEDDQQSLVSFVLSEVSATGPVMRKRTTAAASAEQRAPTIFGMMSAVVPSAV